MALNSEVQTYQILTKDDEICISSLSSIHLAVPTSLKFLTAIFFSGLSLLCVEQNFTLFFYLSIDIFFLLQPPKKPAHPGEENRVRGFDRGLQAEKIIGATDATGELISYRDAI